MSGQNPDPTKSGFSRSLGNFSRRIAAFALSNTNTVDTQEKATAQSTPIKTNENKENPAIKIINLSQSEGETQTPILEVLNRNNFANFLQQVPDELPTPTPEQETPTELSTPAQGLSFRKLRSRTIYNKARIVNNREKTQKKKKIVPSSLRLIKEKSQRRSVNNKERSEITLSKIQKDFKYISNNIKMIPNNFMNVPGPSGIGNHKFKNSVGPSFVLNPDRLSQYKMAPQKQVPQYIPTIPRQQPQYRMEPQAHLQNTIDEDEVQRNFTNDDSYHLEPTLLPIVKTHKTFLSSVPIFSGTGLDIENEINVFLELAEHAYLMTVEDQRPLLLRMLIQSKLIGRANSLFRHASVRSFEQFREILLNRFVENKDISTLASEISQVYQLPDESVELFGERIADKLAAYITRVNKEYPNENRALKFEMEKTAKRVFLGGLRSESVKQYLLLKNPDTLRVAIGAAREYVRDTAGLNNQMNLVPNTVPVVAQQNEMMAMLAEMMKKLDTNQNSVKTPENITKVETNRNKDNNNVRNNNNTNNNYNKNNYNYDNNRNERYDRNNKNNSYERNNRNDRYERSIYNNNNNNNTPRMDSNRNGNIKCYKCGAMGHYSRECRNNNLERQRPATTNAVRNQAAQIHTIETQHTPTIVEVQENCEFCRRDGHRALNCIYRQSWEANMALRSGNDAGMN